jgi:hypothetical protein
MSRYLVTVYVSNDFRRTTDLAYGFSIEPGGDSFAQAALDGVYDGDNLTFTAEADSHAGAAEVAWEVCNSYYPDEMFCPEKYAESVRCYRQRGNRSLSMGDMVIVRNLDTPDAADGRYVAVSVGFRFLG